MIWVCVCVVLGAFFECESSHKVVRDFPSQVRCFYNFQSLIVLCVHILILAGSITCLRIRGSHWHPVRHDLASGVYEITWLLWCFGIIHQVQSLLWYHLGWVQYLLGSQFRTKVSYWYWIQFTHLTFPGIKHMLHKFTAGWFLSLSCS